MKDTLVLDMVGEGTRKHIHLAGYMHMLHSTVFTVRLKPNTIVTYLDNSPSPLAVSCVCDLGVKTCHEVLRVLITDAFAGVNRVTLHSCHFGL